MMLVPAVLQADWDLLQDHSQGVEKHWEVPAAVSLQKQLTFGADLQIVFCSLINNAD
jgi:predicted oxidoreductase (fatty acid repression mutant protein)